MIEDDRQQHAATVLKDVGCVIEAHTVLTVRASEGETVAKHIEMFKCHAAKGQYLQQPLQRRQSVFFLVDVVDLPCTNI